eukprot:3851453-Prymnesium_polylepis.1
MRVRRGAANVWPFCRTSAASGGKVKMSRHTLRLRALTSMQRSRADGLSWRAERTRPHTPACSARPAAHISFVRNQAGV